MIEVYNYTYFWGKIKHFKQKPNTGKEADRQHSHCCEERKLEQPLWSTVWRILKKLKISLYDLSSHLTMKASKLLDSAMHMGLRGYIQKEPLQCFGHNLTAVILYKVRAFKYAEELSHSNEQALHFQWISPSTYLGHPNRKVAKSNI